MADPFALTPFRDPGDSTMFADIQKIRKIRQDNELQRQQQERAAAFDADFNAMMESGVNSKAMSGMFLKYPEMSKKYADAFKGVKEDELRVHRLDLNKVSTLLDEEQPEIASRYLRDVAEKWKNSGFDDVASGYLSAADALEKNPTQGGLYLHGLHAAIDPDAANKAQEGLETIAKRKGQEVKTELDKFELGVQEQKLKTEQQQAEADLAQTKAETKKLDLEMKAAAEADGKLPPEKIADFEDKLSSKYFGNTDVKNFLDVRASYDRVEASSNDAAGDLALIFNYMKMLDPGSTVREGEFANAQNAGTAWDKVGNLYNNLMKGTRLTDGQRKMFKGQAKSLFNKTKVRESSIRKGIERIAKNRGLNLENVFLEDAQKMPEEKQDSSQIKFLGWE